MSEATDSRLARLAERLAYEMGLYFPKERLSDLTRGIAAAGRELGFKEADSCVEWLLSASLTRRQLDVLAGHLTIGETYFFREKESLKVFASHILEQILHRHSADRCLRIWSAGCATGEEPHSIAISLIESMPDLADWNVTILATDLNPRYLLKASRGVYGEWSFRQCPPGIKEAYFRETGDGSFEIVPDVKKMVTFAHHNLARDVFPSIWNNTDAMDVIFCRNVLMYFARDVAKRVLDNFYHCLVTDGYLIVSPSEASPVFHPRFAIASYPGCSSIYHKSKDDETLATAKGTESPAYATLKTVQVSPVFPVTLNFENWLSTPPTSEPVTLSAARIEAEPSSPEPGHDPERDEEINRLLEADPHDALAMMKLARLRADQGRLGEAVQWCRKGIASDKLNPAHHYLMSTILLEQGQMEEAAKSLKRALYLDPDFALAHFALGNLALRLGRQKESARHFSNTFSLLRKFRPEEIVPGSDGITAGYLTEVVRPHVEEPV